MGNTLAPPERAVWEKWAAKRIMKSLLEHISFNTCCTPGRDSKLENEGLELRVSTDHTGGNASPSWRNENVDTSAEALGETEVILRDTKEMASLENSVYGKQREWGRMRGAGGISW